MHNYSNSRHYRKSGGLKGNRLQTHYITGQAAGTFSLNLVSIVPLALNDPIGVALTGWIDTADPLDTAIMQFAINYIDATGNPHQVLFQANPQIIMNDSTQFFVTDVVILKRLDLPSAWSLDGYLVFGTARNARYTLGLNLIDSNGSIPF